MIAELLNHDFVLARLAAVRAHLERSPNELPDLLEALRVTESSERSRSSGQRGGFEPPALRAPKIDDVAYFSRDPVVSLAQSALDAYVDDRHVPTVDVVEASTHLPLAADRSLEGVDLHVASDGRRAFGAFELADVGWVASAMAAGLRQLRGRHPFTPRPASPLRISNHARLLLVGDWGTGLLRAQAVAGQMRRVLEDGMARGLDQHVVHLGDVYYSGWAWEYEKRFLAHWPVATGEAGRVSSWAVNGNHDMYSGGHGYFDHLLADPRFLGHEGSSFFSLHNDDWEILGLDTAWEDGDLAEPQPEWVGQRLAASGRKLVLLSHHQLFSVYQRAGAALRSTLRGPLGTGRVRAWYWGHEHRCMLFRRYNGVEAARCIGHGGVPVYMWRDPKVPCPAPAVYEYRDRFWKGGEPWALFGFAVLDFDGPSARARYIDEHGVEHKSEQLS